MEKLKSSEVLKMKNLNLKMKDIQIMLMKKDTVNIAKLNMFISLKNLSNLILL